MRATAKRQGPGEGAAHATAGRCRDIKVPTNPKAVNTKLGKSQDMDSRSQRTDITPGEVMDRHGNWYGKKPRTSGGGIMGALRSMFG